MRKTILGIAAAAACLCSGFGAAPEGDSFRVVPRNGVPLLLRNGTPIAPRMIYVRREDQTPLPATPEFQEFSLDFLPRANSGAAAVQFTVMNNDWTPGEIDFAELRVEDADTGRELKRYRFDGEKPDPDCLYWSRDTKLAPVGLSTVRDAAAPGGLLRLAFRDAPDGKRNLAGFTLAFAGFAVEKGHAVRLRGRIRAGHDRVFTGGLYQLRPEWMPLSYPGPALAQLRMARNAGVNLVTVNIEGIWVKPGEKPDYSQIDQAYQTVLTGNPDARIIPRVRSLPPEWWAKRYPEELMQYEDGSEPRHASIASERWRADAAEALRRVIRYSEEHYGPHMAGYHPTGGNTDEWFYNQSWNRLSGYDPATLRAWRKWLRARYGNDAELRRAWRNSTVTLDAAAIPTPAERRGPADEALLRPDLTNVLDFARFRQENIVDAALGQAKVVREETGGRRLSLLFYGYLLHFGWTSAPPSNTGHYALRRLLDSPDVDIVAGPISYFGRQFGEVGCTMTVSESVTLAGKLWLNEDDTSTHLAYRYGNRAIGWRDSAKNQKESIDLLRRNLAAAELRNFGIWLMDLCGTGAFNDSELWAQLKRLDEATAFRRADPSPYRPEAAEIIDDRSMQFVTGAGATAATKNLLYEDRLFRARAGAPLGQYLLDDLLAGRVPSKLNFIVAAWALNGSQRRQLRAIAERTPTFWCWAPGLIDLDTGTFSTKAVEETTGFEVRLLDGVTFATRATPAGIAFGLAPKKNAPVDKAVTPVLSPVPRRGDVVLAAYNDNSPAIVLRPGRVPALFCGTPIIDIGAYRGFIRQAGLHLYTDRPAGLIVNDGLLSVCPTETGEYVIDTGSNAPVSDVFEGKDLGRGPKLKLQLNRGETKLLRIRQER